MDKEILILAKSFKKGGKCIAGRELVGSATSPGLGNWIRPVVGSGPVGNRVCVLDSGRPVQVLDLVRIKMIRYAGIPGQPENYLIDAGVPWTKLGTYPPSLLPQFTENPSNLWVEPGAPTGYVTPSYITDTPPTQSLYIIQPTNLYFVASRYGERIKKQAYFLYNRTNYSLPVTDPVLSDYIDNLLRSCALFPPSITLPNGDNYLLCVSLGGLFADKQRHYKLVASIIDPSGKFF